MKRQLISLLFGAVFIIPLFVSAAVMQQASIITRPGVTTSPIKYYFDFSSALSKGINHTVKVTVSASNSEKTAIRFESVQLFNQSGVVIGNNVASKTDALSSTPYSFVFQNFGISSADLKKVAGVELKFLDLGGDNPTGKVLVGGVTVSVDRNTGLACIIADPFVLPKPVITINEIQTERPLVQPGTHGTGDASSGGGNSGFTNPGSGANGIIGGGSAWTNPSNITSSDDARATISLGPSQSSGGLYASSFGFTIPSSATITGITVNIEKGGGVARDSAVGIVVGGAITGTDHAMATTWPTTETVVAYGGETDTWGVAGATLTPTAVNATNFGVAFSATNQTGGTASLSVDNVQIKITYSGGASVYDTFGALVRTLFKKIDAHIRLRHN